MFSSASSINFFRVLLAGLVLLFFICLNSCRKSDGTDASDSGQVSIEVQPSIIAKGGLGFISVNFDGVQYDDIDTDGLTLKLMIPNGFNYIENSAALVLPNRAQAIEKLFVGSAPEEVVLELIPDETLQGMIPSEWQTPGFTFLVFAITPEMLKRESSGSIQFDIDISSKPVVPMVYADLDRGAITQFDAEQAGFDNETSVEVAVLTP